MLKATRHVSLKKPKWLRVNKKRSIIDTNEITINEQY